MHVDLKFHPFLGAAECRDEPILIIGQLRHLIDLQYSDLTLSNFAERVTERTFNDGMDRLQQSSVDKVSLYLDKIVMATLPSKCSRHNTPSRSHSITKLVKAYIYSKSGTEESVVIVCERSNVFASACAVARAFPLYSRRTLNGTLLVEDEDENNAKVFESRNGDNNSGVLNIQFIIIEEQQLEGDGPPCNVVSKETLSPEDMKCLEAAVKAVRLTARLVDTPCCEMNVKKFIDFIKDIGKTLNIEPEIIEGEDLKTSGFGGIYGVGKAATIPPALVVLSHRPKNAKENIAWVGKGIVYDTGGLSLKGKSAMPGMKRDCGGAAAILGAFYAAVVCGFKENLHAVFCLAENAIGPNAIRFKVYTIIYVLRFLLNYWTCNE